MKKYLILGNPLSHSLSPKLHNYWIKQNNLEGVYEAKETNEESIKEVISDIKKGEIEGMNVTVPFKKTVIPYLDQLSIESKNTQSVNTIYLNNNKTIGHNTDIEGFERSIKETKLDIKNKKVLILGAGGVAPSIIFALYKMKVSEIMITNRTKSKAEDLKGLFKNLKIVDWGKVPEFDIIINATSVGLKKGDEINLDFSKIGKNKFFYDLIYNPNETNFLKIGKNLGSRTENGKLMFVYQALAAFNVWHGIQPEINNEVIKLLD